ncbi:10384_t:CDS:2 [Rhizophagus irregularis]|nr:10384_t:CDS:2 [Rhizophagus irregularis]
MAKYSKQPPHVDDDIIKEGMNKYKHHKNPYVMISRSISHRQSAKYIYYR